MCTAQSVTPDAAAHAEMLATQTVVSAIAAADSAAVATQSAIDLQLSDAIAQATIHAVEVDQTAKSAAVQMNLNAQTVQLAQQQERGQEHKEADDVFDAIEAGAEVGGEVVHVGSGRGEYRSNPAQNGSVLSHHFLHLWLLAGFDGDGVSEAVQTAGL